MFRSFIWAGFECATGLNARRERIDQVVATGHERFLAEDYSRVAALGMRTVREGVRWSIVDRGGCMNFSSLARILDAAQCNEIELVLDLFHYGYPDGVDLFSESFVDRFAEYSYSVARFAAQHVDRDDAVAFTPLNEPSFFSWAAGEVGLFAPHAIGRGWELKVWLMRAALRAIDAIWSAWPDARIVNVDPICRVVQPFDRFDLETELSEFNDVAVFQAYDMLAGRLLPELGGSPRHLGVVGINYYWTNQWEYGHAERPLDDRDPRRQSLAEIVRTVWERYGTHVAVTETSHAGELRAPWIREAASEALLLLDEGVPIRGLCLYPVLGMPEWHEPDTWTNMGLWDVDATSLARIPFEPAIAELTDARARFDAHPALAGPRAHARVAAED